jgi:cyclopropane fatty-acyl-phospholipid synthase-like methyltransferase
MEWFKDWFDSKYYHILYNHRNDNEAQLFIDNLLTYLKPEKGATMLDLACGKGRHSKYLNAKGFDVTGVDLSGNSIADAKQFETNSLHFYEHDMRRVLSANNFDFVFSFFTSMGYFEKSTDDTKQFNAMHTALKPNGSLIIDFLNTEKSKQNLIATRTIEKENIQFNIKSYFQNGFFNKVTEVIDGDKTCSSHEKVRGFLLADFEQLLQQQNFKIVNIFGDYQLNKFDVTTSDRLIIHAKK